MVPLSPPALVGALLRAAAEDGLGLARLDGACAPDDPIVGRDADLLASWRPWPLWTGLVRRVAEAAGWRLCLSVPRGGVLLLFLASRAAEGEPDCLQIDLHRVLSARGLPYERAADVLAGGQLMQGALRLEREVSDRLRRDGKVLVAAGLRARLALLAGAVVRRPDEMARLWMAKAGDALHRLACPPGRMIAVSGPDGAGKSTLLDRLAERLPRRLAPEVRRFHTRTFVLPRLGRPPTGGGAPDANRRTGRVRSWARLLLAWADWWIGHLLIVRWHLAAGRIVLFDRYSSDYLVAPRPRGIDLPGNRLTLLEHVPRPSVAIFIVAEPAALVRRKGELDGDEALRQVEAYRALAHRMPNALLLDSGIADAEQIAAAACRHIVEVLSSDAHPARA